MSWLLCRGTCGTCVWWLSRLFSPLIPSWCPSFCMDACERDWQRALSSIGEAGRQGRRALLHSGFVGSAGLFSSIYPLHLALFLRPCFLVSAAVFIAFSWREKRRKQWVWILLFSSSHVVTWAPWRPLLVWSSSEDRSEQITSILNAKLKFKKNKLNSWHYSIIYSL